jgi:S-formylglutathione hydrolase
MGGHGALVCALRNPELYQSVSAFAPIVAPSQVPWGQKAFTHYLGPDTATWANYDACALVRQTPFPHPILIDQGLGDNFLETQLLPQHFAQACQEVNQPLQLRYQPGYDHGYYFITSFIADHLQHHATQLYGA